MDEQLSMILSCKINLFADHCFGRTLNVWLTSYIVISFIHRIKSCNVHQVQKALHL